MKKIINKIKKINMKRNIFIFFLFFIIIFIYFFVNIIFEKINLKDIDFTKNQLYSLSEESKTKIASINKKIKIELINLDSYQYIEEYIKKYRDLNQNIEIEKISNIASRPDLLLEYEVGEQEPLIVIKCENRVETLQLSDLYMFEYSEDSFDEINITEEAITNGILDVTSEKKSQVYLYTTNSIYAQKNFNALVESINKDLNNVHYLDMLSSNGIPEDCECIIISTLKQDISDTEKNYLKEYIMNGGNIVLLQDANSILNSELKNYNEILDLYGFKISDGIIMEQNSEKMINNAPGFIISKINPNSSIMKNINMDINICVMDAGKIEFKDEEILDELKVTYEVLAKSSESSFLRKDFNIKDFNKTDKDEDSPNSILAAIVTKEINEKCNSKLIVYSNCIFATNMGINIDNNNMSAITFYNNEDMIVNSVNYLTNKENIITIRKKIGDNVMFAITKKQNSNIIKIIYGVPLIIIFIGIIIWIIRRRLV